MSEIPKGVRNRIRTPDMYYRISVEDCISNMGCHMSIKELSLMAIDLLRDFTNLSLQSLSPMKESDMITVAFL